MPVGATQHDANLPEVAQVIEDGLERNGHERGALCGRANGLTDTARRDMPYAHPVDANVVWGAFAYDSRV